MGVENKGMWEGRHRSATDGNELGGGEELRVFAYGHHARLYSASCGRRKAAGSVELDRAISYSTACYRFKSPGEGAWANAIKPVDRALSS